MSVGPGEEIISPAAFVRRNREFPGRWHVNVTDLVEQGDRAVSYAQVSDGTVDYHVASFATIRGGLVAGLTEVWTSETAIRPAPLLDPDMNRWGCPIASSAWMGAFPSTQRTMLICRTTAECPEGR